MNSPNAREKLIDAGISLMRSKGYPATTVDEICAAAGVSKGSFYHFFKTKEELGLAMLTCYYERGQQRLMVDHPDIQDPVERVFAFLEHVEAVAHELWSEGCLLGTIAVDLAETNPTVQERVAEIFTELAQNLGRRFEPVAALGEERISPEQLAEQFLAVLEGAIVLAKAHNDWTRVPQALRNFRGYVGLLVGQTA